MRTVAIVALLIAVSVCFIGHAAVGSATSVPVSVNESDDITVIHIHPNGNAKFSVIRTVQIRTQNGSAAFNKTAQAYEKVGSSSLDSFDSLLTFKRTARAVGNESNRSMRIVDVTNDTARRGNTGIFYQNFTWTNFVAPPEGDAAVNLNDSFTAGGRPWFRRLGADHKLVISYSHRYELQGGTNVDRVEKNAWVFTGPRTFSEFDIYYQKQSYQGSGGGGVSDGIDPPVSAVALVAVVVVGSIGVFAYSRRRPLFGGIFGGDTRFPDWDRSDTASTNEHENGTEQDGAPIVELSGGSDTDPTTDQIDLELLSDEERVERLLQNNGGRMRQATIVTETDWSDAKVSQLLSAMDEDDRIEKLRIGRENLISLPNHDPGLDAGSDPDHAGND